MRDYHRCTKDNHEVCKRASADVMRDKKFLGTLSEGV